MTAGKRAQLMSVVLLLAVFAAGCESSSKGSDKAPEESSSETAEAVTDVPAPTQAKSPAVPEGTLQLDSTIIGGNAGYGLEGQSIGNGVHVPGLVVNDIRWGNHGEYFRIVFELANADGSDVAYVPNCHTFYQQLYYGIAVSIDDIPTYEYGFTVFQVPDAPVSLGDPLVLSMYRWATADTEPVTFAVECAYSEAHPGVSSRPHCLMYQTDPMRIIVDIQKM